MVLALAFALPVPLALATPEAYAEPDDPALEQTVNDDENISRSKETTVIRDGHVDLGPIMIDGELDFLARDDSADTPVWRNLDDVVFVLGESSAQTLPDSGDYDFTGVSAGGTVYAVPQTQVPGVPWLGWSTQSPEVTRMVSRGITLEYEAHQGPGIFTVFVQSGGFGEPQQLWSSKLPQRQPIWVDLKTHAHANWVFSEPGVHLVRLGIRAKMIDGTEQNVSKTLRFAVAGASVDDAVKEQWTQNIPEDTGDTGTETVSASAPDDSATHSTRVLSRVTAGLFIATGVLVFAALVLWVRDRRARTEALRRSSNE